MRWSGGESNERLIGGSRNLKIVEHALNCAVVVVGLQGLKANVAQGHGFAGVVCGLVNQAGQVVL